MANKPIVLPVGLTDARTLASVLTLLKARMEPTLIQADGHGGVWDPKDDKVTRRTAPGDVARYLRAVPKDAHVWAGLNDDGEYLVEVSHGPDNDEPPTGDACFRTQLWVVA